jgi:hypothetical protein
VNIQAKKIFSRVLPLFSDLRCFRSEDSKCGLIGHLFTCRLSYICMYILRTLECWPTLRKTQYSLQLSFKIMVAICISIPCHKHYKIKGFIRILFNICYFIVIILAYLYIDYIVWCTITILKGQAWNPRMNTPFSQSVFSFPFDSFCKSIRRYSWDRVRLKLKT